jgi:hypothetical protein
VTPRKPKTLIDKIVDKLMAVGMSERRAPGTAKVVAPIGRRSFLGKHIHMRSANGLWLGSPLLRRNQSMYCLQFDEKTGIFLDEQLLPVPNGTIRHLMTQMAKHLKHSDEEIVTLARRQVERHHPGMVDQMNWDCFRA